MSRKLFSTGSLAALAVAGLLAVSGCTTTRGEQGDDTTGEENGSAVEEDQADEDWSGRSSRSGRVSRKPFYHPGSQANIAAMEGSLKSLEVIPVAHAEDGGAAGGESD